MKNRILIILALALTQCASHTWEDGFMSYTYGGNVANYPALLTLPAGSDLKDVSTVDVPFEGLADRTAYLADKTVFLAGTDRVEVPVFPASASSHFTLQNGSSPMWGTGLGWLQTSVGSAGHVWLEVGVNLKYYQFQSVLCYVKGKNTTAHADLPGTKPQVSFWRWPDPYRGQTFTADAGTDVFTATAHGMLAGNALRLENTGGGLPTGVNTTTTYYVKTVTTNTFQLATMSDLSDTVNITTNGTGTHAFYSIPGMVDTPSVDASSTAIAYDVSHFIALPLTTIETIDRRPGATYPYARYFVKFEGETGANALANELLLKTCRLAPGIFG